MKQKESIVRASTPSFYVVRKVVEITLQSDPIPAQTHEEAEEIALKPDYDNWRLVGDANLQQVLYQKIELTKIY